MDAGSGEVLFGQKANKKIYPASTAKLMTAIVCVEKGNVNSVIKTKSRCSISAQHQVHTVWESEPV